MFDIINRFLSVVYPNRCICCKKLITSKYLCDECNEKLRQIEVLTCKKCGLPMKHCCCNRYFYYFDEVYSVFENTDCAKQIMYNLKFDSYKRASVFFADCIANRLRENNILSKTDYICAVPMHHKNQRLRGYNQAEIIAKLLSRQFDIPFKRLLSQPKQTKLQHNSKDVSERFENARGKYKFLSKEIIKDKNILVIDDIKTTGATLSECSKILKFSGADEVYAATALITYPKAKNKADADQKDKLSEF